MTATLPRPRTCGLCAAPITQPRRSGRPRRYCSKAHGRAAWTVRARAAGRRPTPRRIDHWTPRPLGPVPAPDAVVALAKAVYLQAWRDHEAAWLRDHAEQGLWRAILCATRVEGLA